MHSKHESLVISYLCALAQKTIWQWSSNATWTTPNALCLYAIMWRNAFEKWELGYFLLCTVGVDFKTSSQRPFTNLLEKSPLVNINLPLLCKIWIRAFWTIRVIDVCTAAQCIWRRSSGFGISLPNCLLVKRTHDVRHLKALVLQVHFFTSAFGQVNSSTQHLL